MSVVDAVGGSLPKNWKICTIGEICDKHGGEVQTGPFGSQLHASDYVEDGVPSVMPKDIIGSHISDIGIARVPESDAIRLAIHRLREGDIVYARRGDIGRRALVSARENGWLCGTGCLRIRFNSPNVDPAYVLAYLGHPSVVEWVEARAQGATMLNLNTTILRGVPLRIPPIAEQRRIATILDKADEIRRKRREAIALTEDLLRSTFLEIFGDPVTNPKGWSRVPLAEISQVQGGLQVTHARANLPMKMPYLRVANVHRDRLDLREMKEICLSDAEYVRARLCAGDVLVVEGHGNPGELGRAAVWDGSIDPCTHQNHLIRVRANGELVVAEYLAAYLNSTEGRRQMLALGKTTSGLNTISTNNVRSIAVALPPLEKQQRFAEVVAAVRGTAAKHIAGAIDCDKLFDSLVHRAFRGEL